MKVRRGIGVSWAGLSIGRVGRVKRASWVVRASLVGFQASSLVGLEWG